MTLAGCNSASRDCPGAPGIPLGLVVTKVLREGKTAWSHGATSDAEVGTLCGICALCEAPPRLAHKFSMNTTELFIEKQWQPQFASAEGNDFVGPNSSAGALTMQQKVQLSGGTRTARQTGGPLGALTELSMAAVRVRVQLVLMILQWPC